MSSRRLLVSLHSLRRMASGTEASGKLNRLAKEKSPYLLQHAANPVDWYPWGQEAFDKARSEDKPIFLSVGYSTCHWCHVMERESFESEEIGDILRENFVSIKVDREERPDVDKVYMTFIQATQGGGGWPMSVFLTPELKPFVGGTYFPPKDSYGRPGFSTILKSIAEQWKKDRDRIIQQGSRIIDAISEAVSTSSKGKEGEGGGLPGTGCIQRGYEMLEKRFDSKYGGYGNAPKFPQPTILNFLLGVFSRYPNSPMGERALETVLFTLKAMANGGMYDHVGQGFHRYSTDKFWHVPHFEKMLYDQGQLATIYSTAYQITKDEFFAEVLRDILLYVSRDLSDKDGGFYSAEDADSFPAAGSEHKKEGAFCVWTKEEITNTLVDPLPSDSTKTLADLFSFHYDVQEEGNVNPYQDPHGELTGQNVLIVRGSLEKTAEEFKMEASQTKELLAKCREALYAVRQKRPKPHRDDKILTAWNGLMISGLSRAYQALGDSAYLERATRTAQFVQSQLYKPDSGRLIRNAYRDNSSGELGIATTEGFADDYAFLVRGLLDLFEAGQDSQWLEWAWQLQQKMDELFWDKEGGGYFTATTSDPSILIRMKEDQDGAEPSPNSVAAENLHRLSSFLGKMLQPSSAEIYKTFSEMMSQHPVALPEMVCAFIHHNQTPKQIIIVGRKNSEDTKALLSIVNSFYLPNKILVVHEPATSSESFLSRHLEVLGSVKMVDDKATAYVCENYTCSAPVNELERLHKVLNPSKSQI